VGLSCLGRVDASRIRTPSGAVRAIGQFASRCSVPRPSPIPKQNTAADRRSRLVMNEETKARQFRDVALPHLDAAYNLARWLTRNAQDADDVVQDAYMRAYQFFDGFRGTNPRAWILAIVRNSYYAWTRKTRAQAAVRLHATPAGAADNENDVQEIELPDPGHEDAETALIRKAEADTLHALIAALPVAFRETLVLREMEELPYQQIAEITGAPIGTVMSRLARARGLLQKAWAKHQDKERSA
jgi:RNA polymerase sigma factor (sigma-70 family)